MNAETLRKWLRQAQIETGQVEGTATAAAEGIRELKWRNAELERTVEILKAATFSSRGRAAPPQR
jgi:transposase